MSFSTVIQAALPQLTFVGDLREGDRLRTNEENGIVGIDRNPRYPKEPPPPVPIASCSLPVQVIHYSRQAYKAVVENVAAVALAAKRNIEHESTTKAVEMINNLVIGLLKTINTHEENKSRKQITVCEYIKDYQRNLRSLKELQRVLGALPRALAIYDRTIREEPGSLDGSPNGIISYRTNLITDITSNVRHLTALVKRVVGVEEGKMLPATAPPVEQDELNALIRATLHPQQFADPVVTPLLKLESFNIKTVVPSLNAIYGESLVKSVLFLYGLSDEGKLSRDDVYSLMIGCAANIRMEDLRLIAFDVNHPLHDQFAAKLADKQPDTMKMEDWIQVLIIMKNIVRDPRYVDNLTRGYQIQLTNDAALLEAALNGMAQYSFDNPDKTIEKIKSLNRFNYSKQITQEYLPYLFVEGHNFLENVLLLVISPKGAFTLIEAQHVTPEAIDVFGVFFTSLNQKETKKGLSFLAFNTSQKSSQSVNEVFNEAYKSELQATLFENELFREAVHLEVAGNDHGASLAMQALVFILEKQVQEPFMQQLKNISLITRNSAGVEKTVAESFFHQVKVLKNVNFFMRHIAAIEAVGKRLESPNLSELGYYECLPSKTMPNNLFRTLIVMDKMTKTDATVIPARTYSVLFVQRILTTIQADVGMVFGKLNNKTAQKCTESDVNASLDYAHHWSEEAPSDVDFILKPVMFEETEGEADTALVEFYNFARPDAAHPI